MNTEMLLNDFAARSFRYPDELPEDMTVKELFQDGQISIEILGVKGMQVRIGIDAPTSSSYSEMN